MKNKLVLPVMMACTSGLLPAYAHAASSSVVIANYRFPDSLYALLEQGSKSPFIWSIPARVQRNRRAAP